MTLISRRAFLAASSAALAATALPRVLFADSPAIPLKATSRVLDIDGRAATVYGLQGPSGQGLWLNPSERFRVALTNDLDESTIIHWHGQIPPNVQDGVPDLPMPMLKPGEIRGYDYAPNPGTYWMHSHVPLQEMRLLAAPLIVRSHEDLAADRQDVAMFLHDFSFKSPEEVMMEIMAGHAQEGNDTHGEMHAGGMSGMDHSMMSDMDHSMISNMRHGNMAMNDQAGMNGMAMDLNDYDWDAYLTNDRTLSDPDIVRVERGGRIRLRIVNASAATVFWIDTGEVPARLVAVDGHAVQPLTGRRFGVAMAQRLDLEIDLPNGEGAWPILALREGARERTGLILATSGAAITKVDSLGNDNAPPFDTDLAQEARLVAQDPLPERAVQRHQTLVLGGGMQPYRWTIDDVIWSHHVPVPARSGERVELSFRNASMMGHPMHLHGHTFQVVELNGRRIAGARRDTVHVPPMATVKIALDAGEAARWMLHCHHMPHLETGMMTEFEVTSA